MRFATVGLIVACALGCAQSPYEPFDAGFPVHIVVKVTPRPTKTLRLRPVCTLGALVQKGGSFRVGPKGRTAVEVAVFRAPRGEHRFSFWDRTTAAGTKDTLEVERELWVVVRVERGESEGSLEAYEAPPHDEIGAWRPLVAVPD